ncbi:MAG: 4Fe-4S binding protein [Bacteroidales bacterium]|nr:4Fe-4S binding protein [Bacteroidales bacterium]MCF8336350.1 4Fe-4S binding protein [Bacteroidales bacterium]
MNNILIDLTKYRECINEGCDKKVPEGVIGGEPETNGLKPLRELAVFTYTCRQCEDAPCVTVCPEDALEKNEDGMIIRSTNLCVACKSCVTICPFGTMMSDFYEYKRTENLYFNLKDEKEKERFINESPEGTVQYTDKEKDEENNIYELMPGILVKDYPWEKLKKLE